LKLETLISILNTLSASADDALQNSLVIGYEHQSNDVIKKLETPDVISRKQALDIFDYVISTLKRN